MRWVESLVALCAIWALGVGLFWLVNVRESTPLFFFWLVLCPVIGLLVGLGCHRLPGLTWLGLASIPIAFGAILLDRQVWNWDACPSGEEGEYCQIEQVVVWLAGLYALGVAAAIVVGAVISTALRRPDTSRRQIS